MNHSVSPKVMATHMARTAYLYVRQSSLKQVVENTESTTRQYALREQAMALGWPVSQIVTIDTDLGESAASMADREGFKRLLSEVSLGRAGLVMGLEVSRLARNSTDWHRLLELCAFSQTLILDEDGIYDPTDFNDRLLLGLKGAMSEAELHLLRARLRGGAVNKARRGEFRTRLPIGLLYDHEGHVILDPDQQVQATIRLLFDVFRRVGSAFGTLKAFRNDQILFPRRPYHGPHKGELIWRPLTYSQVLSMIHNPRYAGAYYYGRQRSRKQLDGSTLHYTVPREDWIACLPNAHPGYIRWEDYEENLRRLKDNAIASRPDQSTTPAREGLCLLQGIAICGKCGQRMTVRYKSHRPDRVAPVYLCQRDRLEQGADRCQYIPGTTVDPAISNLVLEAVSPLSLDVALAVQDEVHRRAEETDRLRKQQVERAEYEANLAQRRYLRVDPDNRLVARTLEADWNDTLRALQHAQDEYENHRQADILRLSEEQGAKIRSLVSDLPRLWRDPTTPNREKKRMLRLLIDDVTLVKEEDQIRAQVRFKGGAQKTLSIPLPPKGWQHAVTDPQVVAVIDDLLTDHSYTEIATILNERGYTSGTGRPFTRVMIGSIRRNHHLKTRYDRLRKAGKLTITEVATLLGVDKKTVWKLRDKGILKTYPYNDRNECLYEHPGTGTDIL